MNVKENEFPAGRLVHEAAQNLALQFNDERLAGRVWPAAVIYAEMLGG